MPPATRTGGQPRRPDTALSILDPLNDTFINPAGTTPRKRRKRKLAPAVEPEDDEYIQFIKEQLTDDTEEALALAGYREEPEQSSPDEKWCICGITQEELVDMEKMIRCANRQCEPGWFHLECVKIPDHPPPSFGWFCQSCIKRCNVEESLSGLICAHSEDSRKTVRDWLREERNRKKKEEAARAPEIPKTPKRRKRVKTAQKVYDSDETG